MATVLDPRNLPSQSVALPGMKPPVREFAPTDDGDPAEVDTFNRMIRKLRDQAPAGQLAENERAPSGH
jgi:hypothetical protein